ncbi:MAG: SRPBCC family protein [Actinomycetota bacterium]
MTVRFECERLIAAPVARVFDAALSIDAHLASMARSGESAIGGITTGLIGLGQQVTWRARHFGIHWTMTSRIVELEPPHRFVDEQVDGPFAWFRHEHRFTAEGDGTLMTDALSFAAPLGVVGAAAEVVFLRRYLRRLIERRNDHLRTLNEGGDPGR